MRSERLANRPHYLVARVSLRFPNKFQLFRRRDFFFRKNIKFGFVFTTKLEQVNIQVAEQIGRTQKVLQGQQKWKIFFARLIF